MILVSLAAQALAVSSASRASSRRLEGSFSIDMRDIITIGKFCLFSAQL